MTATITVKSASWTTARCLGQCRQVWMVPALRVTKLQQAWEVTTYQDGEIVGQAVEWRDVPFVDEEQS